MLTATVVNCSIRYPDRPWWETPAAAARDGYPAVEFWWPFAGPVASDAELRRLADALHDAGVRLVALNTFGGDLAAGERGILSHPHRVSEVRENAESVARIDRELGCRLHNVLYGERLDGVTGAAQDDTAAANLAYLRETIPVPLLEPLSGTRPDYPVRTADQAAAVIDRVGGGVGLLADLYHLAANDQDVAGTLRAHVDRIAHVQIADHPGRHRPGTGRIPIAAHLALLTELGYRGLVADEYAPL
ncbi:hydroxypyruvate isomerase family protein [Cryptosporangium arvum]|uniref:hydroxypyruvate isomerase family protein n=1 Tax=Cryptosporangium arvum TaxID=80871 RepID=UPI0004B715BD|nr:TIM barrel protein [Cryptosporangium arvum]